MALDPKCFVSTDVKLTLDIYPDSSGSSPAVKISTGPQDTGYQTYWYEFGVLSGWFAIQGRTSRDGCTSDQVWSQLQPSLFREHPMLSRFTLVACFADF